MTPPSRYRRLKGNVWQEQCQSAAARLSTHGIVMYTPHRVAKPASEKEGGLRAKTCPQIGPDQSGHLNLTSLDSISNDFDVFD